MGIKVVRYYVFFTNSFYFNRILTKDGLIEVRRESPASESGDGFLLSLREHFGFRGNFRPRRLRYGAILWRRPTTLAASSVITRGVLG